MTIQPYTIMYDEQGNPIRTDEMATIEKIGIDLASLLGLKPDRYGRYITSVGSKTAFGLALTVDRLINEQAGEEE